MVIIELAVDRLVELARFPPSKFTDTHIGISRWVCVEPRRKHGEAHCKARLSVRRMIREERRLMPAHQAEESARGVCAAHDMV